MTTLEPDWYEVRKLLDTLYGASDRLEKLFPGRKFTLDGHLVGSIGEVIAAYMFDLKLEMASNCGFDAVCSAGRCVEIKLTQGKSVALRSAAEHLIVLSRPKGGPPKVVFDGPGHLAWEAAGRIGKNGQRPIGLSKLVFLNSNVAPPQRIGVKREAPV